MKNIRLSTSIQILLNTIFLIIFLLIVNNYMTARNINSEDWEYWQYYRLVFSKGAGMVSLIFIFLNIVLILMNFNSIKSLSNNKIIFFRIIYSILMLGWSLILFSSTGHISVDEVQFAWYVFIFIEILFSINILSKISKHKLFEQTHSDFLNNNEQNKVINSQMEIPSVCPHCKNPNTKKIRLCEWCGNQII